MAKKVTTRDKDMITRGRMLEAGQGVFPGEESRVDDASNNP